MFSIICVLIQTEGTNIYIQHAQIRHTYTQREREGEGEREKKKHTKLLAIVVPVLFLTQGFSLSSQGRFPFIMLNLSPYFCSSFLQRPPVNYSSHTTLLSLPAIYRQADEMFQYMLQWEGQRGCHTTTPHIYYNWR